jgi:hypothetical protein
MITAVTISLKENIMDITRPRCEIRLDERMKAFERLIQVFQKRERKKKQRGIASEYKPNQSPGK